MIPCPSIETLRQLLAAPQACAGHEALEAHVEGCRRCQEFLARLSQDPQAADWQRLNDAGQPPGTPEPPADFLRRLENSNPFAGMGQGPGAREDAEPAPIRFPGPATPQGPLGQLASYHVEKELGRGSFGVVFQAYDDKLRRVVALKVLKPELAASARDRARFEREGWAAAQIRSEHVVRVYDAGTAPGFPLPYLAMERIDGESLRERLKKTSPLQPREAAEILRQVTLGVAAAHEREVVHGDIKPSNILLEHGTGRARITDFGLARAMGVTDERSLQSGQIVGTPAYMSPEQAASPKQIQKASDLYSLGVVLYEMVTGERPFAGVPYMLLQQVLHEEPRPPRKLNHHIPRDLETMCLKCLEKQPDKRYASALELGEDLGRFLAGELIRARPVSAWERGLKWVRRRPAAAALLAVSVAAGAALLIMGLVVNVWLQLALQDAERERQQARSTNWRAQERLAQLNTTHGVQHLERGDWRGALTLFADAIQADPGDSDRVHGNRIRFQTLLRRFPRLIHVLDHEGRVNYAEFSSDGRRLLTASADGTARLWDAATGQLLTRPLRHGEAVWHATFSPNGQYVLTASSDKTARIWDAATGESRFPPLDHDRRVFHASFSPDGRLALTASDDGTAQIWDAATSAPLTQPLRHEARVYHGSFSPDSRYVVTASEDQTARVWHTATGQPAGQPFKHSGRNAWVYQASFSPDGRYVLTACADGTAQILVVATGQPRLPPLRHNQAVKFAIFSPDGHRVLTASADQTARIWDAATGQPVTSPLPHDGEVYQASFSPDGRYVLTASQDQTARLWDAATGEPLTPPLKHDNEVRHATFSPDGCRLLTAGADGTARLWDVTASRPSLPPLRHDRRVRQVFFSPDGRLLTASADHTVQVWDPTTGESFTPPLPHDAEVYHAEFSRDGSRLLTVGMDKTVRVWNLATGRALAEPLQHESLLDHASFSPDGRRIFTAAWDHTARVWEVAEDYVRSRPLAEGVRVFNATFSPDGRRLLTTSHEKLVRLWDADTGRPLASSFPPDYRARYAALSPAGSHVLLGEDNRAQLWDMATGQAVSPPLPQEGGVGAVGFSPDGRRVLTAGGDRTVRLWDAATGQPLTSPLRHPHPVARAQFSPDGRRVLTVINDNAVRLWDAATGLPLTPPLKHDAPTDRAGFSPDGQRVLVTSQDGQAWMWDVSADERPADDLVLLAQLLCGHRIDEAGHFLPVDPDRRRQAWQTLRAKYPEGFAPSSAEEVLAWQRSQAAECEFRRGWFAARWHLDRLLAAGPPGPGLLYARRANAFAALGLWEQAAADAAQAVPTQPDDPKLWWEHACLRLQIGDTAGYRQACGHLLERFGQTKDPLTALCVTRAGVLAPKAVADPVRLVELTEKAIAYDPHNRHHLHVLGAALYRAGQLDQAVKRLREAQTGKDDAVSDWLLLALTHNRLGHAAEARSWLDKAVQSLDQPSRENPRNPGAPLSWHERLEVQFLLREAEPLGIGRVSPESASTPR